MGRRRVADGEKRVFPQRQVIDSVGFWLETGLIDELKNRFNIRVVGVVDSKGLCHWDHLDAMDGWSPGAGPMS